MNFFADAKLLKADGSSVTVSQELGNKSVLALYFSAHWCPPCRQFTPILKTSFEMSMTTKTGVVFVSSDRSRTEQLSYMQEAHGNWAAVEAGSSLAGQLSSFYGVRGIPALIVIKASDGSVITKDGRRDIIQAGSSAFSMWESSVVEIDTSVVEQLKDNPDTVRKEAAEILLKLLSNVRKDPQNLKYRSIRLSNPKIESKLLTANGAFEILFSIGFEEADDSLVLPFSVSMNVLAEYSEAINSVLKPEISKRVLPTTSSSPSSSPSTSSGSRMSNRQSTQGESFITQMKTGQDFYNKLLSGKNHVLKYEDCDAQEKARSLIPIDTLEERAKQKFDQESKNDPQLSKEFLRDLLLLELLDWFKNDFFEWFDQPTSGVGEVKATLIGSSTPTFQELADGASIVEEYKCPVTGKLFRFPRYHAKPEKLLETRKGRCGEWANCFALCCRALGFDTRHVLDWTDHVWVEVWSLFQERWLHADPCENICDKPLVYEVGWGKKLSYVIAFSKDEVQDVSWRYSKNHNILRSRRNAVESSWLNQSIITLTDECQKNYSKEEKKRLAKRRLLELVELMTSKNDGNLSKEELIGRQSGSESWRKARGEIGSQPQSTRMIWRLSQQEKKSQVFHLEYDIIKDVYMRKSNQEETVNGWQNGVSEYKDILRKEEKDWKMIYLARSEGSSKSSIQWEIDLQDSEMSVKSIELDVLSKTFETGRVVWQLCGGSICLLPQSGVTMKSEELAGAKKVSITAILSGGKGDVAWQHTQLFRTHRDADDGVQFKIIIKLQKD